MKFLDIPFIVEIFFAMSTIVFCIALYAILPPLIYDKRTIFKPLLINSLWSKYAKTFFLENKSKLIPSKKKELNKLFLTVYNGHSFRNKQNL